VTQMRDSEPGTYAQHRFQVPPDGLDLLLIRHGQSQNYVDGTAFPLVDGHGDPPLSELGHEQARLIAARLATTKLSAIYVTTLCRTAQTAAPLAESLRLDPRVEPDLREVHLGEWEGGLYRKMVTDLHPTAVRVFAEERWDVIPGAESSEALADRITAAIGRLADRHRGERIAAFTHGGVIGKIMSMATGSRPFAFIGADNASISRIVIAGDRWLVRGFNDTSHLD
jgi:2,3-bisphosphoglycerate-dependent phosphoglycerate mutase